MREALHDAHRAFLSWRFLTSSRSLFCLCFGYFFGHLSGRLDVRSWTALRGRKNAPLPRNSPLRSRCHIAGHLAAKAAILQRGLASMTWSTQSAEVVFAVGATLRQGNAVVHIGGWLLVALGAHRITVKDELA